MAPIATPMVQRVLERLIYEGALVHNQYEGRRRRVRLRDVLAAGQREPRIYEVLPALLRRKPSAIYRVKQDIREYPDLQRLLETFDTPDAPQEWRGIALEQLRKVEQQLGELWTFTQRNTTKWRTMNLRLTDADLDRLTQLTDELGISSKSAVIRYLLARAVA